MGPVRDGGAAAVAVLVAALLGCARVRPERTATAPPPPPASGAVAFEVLADKTAPSVEIHADQELVGPRAREAPMPDYPPAALKRGVTSVRVTVRIFIEPDGSVGEVVDSPLDTGPPREERDPFRVAVESAVRAWRFDPAGVRTLAPGSDLDGDGKSDYRVMVEEETLRSFVDLRFTFTVADGKGTVELGPGRP